LRKYAAASLLNHPTADAIQEHAGDIKGRIRILHSTCREGRERQISKQPKEMHGKLMGCNQGP
jgi:hypothetical protein